MSRDSAADNGPAKNQKPAAATPRTYPSFPNAVTEVPAWNDVEPPFDLAEFLKAPPDEENAALFYLDALFEFEELSYCYVPSGLKWPEYPEEVKRRVEITRQRWGEERGFREAREKDSKSVDMSAVDAWLAGYNVGFQKLAAAQQRPKCVFQTGLRIDTLLVHTQAVRQVARAALWRTRRDIERGDFERPIQDLKTVLRMSRDLRPRGGLISQLVSIAVDGICCRQIVPAILTAPNVETRHHDRVLALLVEHEAEAVDPFWEGVRADYFMSRYFLHDLQHRTGTFDPRRMKEYFGIKGSVDSWVTCIRITNDLGGGGREGNEKLMVLASRLKTSGSAETEGDALLPSAWTGGKVFSDDNYTKHVNALNRVYASILDLANQPNLLRQPREFRTISIPILKPLWDTTLGVFVPVSALGSVREVCLRGEATLRGTQCLIALRRWQLEHGKLPHDLDTLVKAAGMPGVPIDPFSGQPLRMTVIEGKSVIEGRF